MGRPESQSEDFSKFLGYLNELRSQVCVCAWIPIFVYVVYPMLYVHIKVMTKLSTTVEDEANNRNLLHDLTEVSVVIHHSSCIIDRTYHTLYTQRERKYEESRDMLQSKLGELREEKQQVCNSLDTILRKLQHELHEITLVCWYACEYGYGYGFMYW